MNEELNGGAPLEGASSRPVPIKAVPVRHPWRWVASVVLVILAAMLIHTLVFSQTQQPHQTGSRFSWNIVGQYIFSAQILHGVVITIELTIVSMIIGVILGVVLAVMRLSKSRLISGVAWVYIWFFRGTPVLVQIIFWFNIAAIYPTLSLGIPFGPSFYTINVNAVLTPFVAGALALSLNEGAYMSEIVRAGIISVDEGQSEAAHSLGMSKGKGLRLIVLPQAMRLIIPPTGNETISMLKTTSLVSAVALTDLLKAAENISAQNYQIIPLLIVASLWYLAMTTVLSIGQYYLERHYAKGSTRALPLTPFQQLKKNMRHFKPADEPAKERVVG
jgi:polar amino acid transport system permease protein